MDLSVLVAVICLLVGQLEVLCNNYKWNYNYNWRTQSQSQNQAQNYYRYNWNTNTNTNANANTRAISNYNNSFKNNRNTNTNFVRYTNATNTNGYRYNTKVKTNTVQYTTNGQTKTNTNHYVTTTINNNNNNVRNYQSYSYRVNFQDFEFMGLNWHNKYRQAHQAAGMQLDASLNERAKNCAFYYANRGTIDHSCNQKDGAGENLFMILGNSKSLGPGASEATRRAVAAWYNEVSLYKNYANQFGMSHATGHFTQLVWQTSRKLGIGVATVRGKTCVVALYYPPGNYYGRFSQEVLPRVRG